MVMLPYIFALLLLLHGLIHFMGFAKAFDYGDMKQLTIPISKPAGIFWMITAFLLIITAVLFLLKTDAWRYLAIPALLLSQVLIVLSWKDAKFGTLGNLVALLMIQLYW